MLELKNITYKIINKGVEKIILNNVSCTFEDNCLTAITGHNGSGKSTLVNDIIASSLQRKLYRSKNHVGKHESLEGLENIDKVKKDACLFYKDRDITYKYYDVYKFNGITYQNFISNIIDDLKSHGATFADNTEVVNITRDPITSYYKIKVKTPKNELEYNIHTLILATGALDLNDNLICNLPGFNGRIYEIGIRVEVPSVYLKKYEENCISRQILVNLLKIIERFVFIVFYWELCQR